jgi:hypothetical protein
MPGPDPKPYRPDPSPSGQTKDPSRSAGRGASPSSPPITPAPTIEAGASPRDVDLGPPKKASPSASAPAFVPPKDRDRPSSPPESSSRHRAQERIAEGVADAEQEARARVELGRSEIAGHVASVAQALHEVSDQLRENQEETIARYAERAGDGVQRLSEYLERKDSSELLRDARRLARNHPAAFLGGAALIGFAAARFLKSGEESSRERGGDGSQRSERSGSIGGMQFGAPSGGSATSGSARESSLPRPGGFGGRPPAPPMRSGGMR